MWDGELTARVRERKLNEIMTYAALVKLDPENKDAYIEIIDALSLDIDACDALIETDGEAEIVLEPIKCEAYVSRLGQREYDDEVEFVAYNRILPCDDEEVEPEEDLRDYVRGLLQDAVASLRAESRADADEGVDALKTELRLCRDRIESLSNELEFSRAEVAEAQASADDFRRQTEKLTIEAESLRRQLREAGNGRAADTMSGNMSDVASQFADVVQQVIGSMFPSGADASGIAVAEDEWPDTEVPAGESGTGPTPIQVDPTDEAPADACSCGSDAVPATVEEPAPTESENADAPCPDPDGPDAAQEERAIVDRILTDAELEMLLKIVDMKNRKTDEFIEKSMSGRSNVTACDNVVTFLKVDLSICNALLAMDYTDMDSIIRGFNEIMDILETAPEPKSQSLYIRSLSPEELVIEGGYNKIIERVQATLLERYSDVL